MNFRKLIEEKLPYGQDVTIHNDNRLVPYRPQIFSLEFFWLVFDIGTLTQIPKHWLSEAL